MGFFFWLLCTILVVALVLLLFPFSVRIEFEAGERSGRALFFFFKKKIYEYEKRWGKVETSRAQDESRSDKLACRYDRGEAPDAEGVKEDKCVDRESRPAETSDERRAVSKSVDDGRNGSTSSATSCHPELNVVESKDPERLDERRKTSDDSGNNVIQEPKKEKPKKEKPKLTDREFWTILLTPDLDARAFKYALKIIASVFSLFRIRFNDCFVEGVRTDYVTMGYIAALNGIMKAYPYVGAWDLRMDWLHEKELRAAGNVRLSITLLRIICFILETLVLAGILAFIFWRRRAHVLKTKELPEIGFIRKKIVDFILED